MSLFPFKNSHRIRSAINMATMMEVQEGESNNEKHGVTLIISPDELLKIGLRLAGYKRQTFL
jgi:hypothetical protein